MRSDTQTVTIEARPDAVLRFVADARNLPRWAVGFATDVRPDHDRWMVTSGQGEIGLSIDSDAATGTVDFRMQPAAGAETTAYARVVPNGNGTELVFTQLQQPGTPDDVFDRLVAAVRHELVVLKALLEVECPL